MHGIYSHAFGGLCIELLWDAVNLCILKLDSLALLWRLFSFTGAFLGKEGIFPCSSNFRRMVSDSRNKDDIMLPCE